jgi:hypothetical protein
MKDSTKDKIEGTTHEVKVNLPPEVRQTVKTLFAVR